MKQYEFLMIEGKICYCKENVNDNLSADKPCLFQHLLRELHELF